MKIGAEILKKCAILLLPIHLCVYTDKGLNVIQNIQKEWTEKLR